MVVSLSPSDKSALLLIAEGSNPSLSRRARIVLAWDEGAEPEQIAEQLGLTVRTVRQWIRAFSEQGLGIFPTEALPQTQETLQPEMPAKRMTIAELCQRYQVDMAHGHHVGQLAAELFDLTQPIHQLDPRYGRVIYNAGLLHNVAFAGGVAKHHTRGRDILLENPLEDMDQADQALIAVTTAFHRKAWRNSRLETESSYVALPADARPVALTLAALVRIADGLDYSQSQTTVISRSQVEAGRIHITVAGPFAETDSSRADQKADLWRAIFEVPIFIVPFADRAAEPSAVLADKPGILPDDLMSEAGRKLLKFHVQRMIRHEPGTRAGNDIEALHDMRVAIRRMRAVLDVFGAYYKPKPLRRLRRGLRGVGRALGKVRDLDVFMENAQKYLATLPPERQHELDVLFEHWRDQREEARQEMLAYLDGNKHQEFMAYLTEFVETPDLGSADTSSIDAKPVYVKHVAPRQLYTRYETVRAYETILNNAPIEVLHKLRIDGKRLRYTLEFFREVLGPEAEELIGNTVRMQDHLGALNDASVAQSILRRAMQQILKKARKQQNDESSGLPDLGGIVAYLEYRESEFERLYQTFPEVWSTIVAPETRYKLALAVSTL